MKAKYKIVQSDYASDCVKYMNDAIREGYVLCKDQLFSKGDSLYKFNILMELEDESI